MTRTLPWLFALGLFTSCGDSPDAPDARDSGARDSGAPAADAGADLDGAASDGAGAPDAGAPGPLCDPRAPACAAGQKCTTTRWDLSAPWPAPRCVPDIAQAGKGESEACFSAPGFADGCGTGLACTNYGTGEGYCRATCGAGEACPEGFVCAPVDAATGFALCLTSCTDTEDCGAPGWLACVEKGGVQFCDGARATP